MDGGTDGNSYGITFNRNDDKRNVNCNRNDNDWNDNWWFAGRRPRNFLLETLLILNQGSFFYKLFLPTAEHFAGLC